MTFQTPSGFTEVSTDSGNATITNTKPNLDIVGTNGVSTSASGNTITVDGSSGNGSLIHLETQTVSSVTEVVFNSFTSANKYLLTFQGVILDLGPASVKSLNIQFSNDNGATYFTSPNYKSIVFGRSTGSGIAKGSETSTTLILADNYAPSATDNTINGEAYITQTAGHNASMNSFAMYPSDVTHSMIHSAGIAPSSGMNAFRIFNTALDPITEGQFVLYRLKDS